MNFSIVCKHNNYTHLHSAMYLYTYSYSTSRSNLLLSPIRDFPANNIILIATNGKKEMAKGKNKTIHDGNKCTQSVLLQSYLLLDMTFRGVYIYVRIIRVCIQIWSKRLIPCFIGCCSNHCFQSIESCQMMKENTFTLCQDLFDFSNDKRMLTVNQISSYKSQSSIYLYPYYTYLSICMHMQCIDYYSKCESKSNDIDFSFLLLVLLFSLLPYCCLVFSFNCRNKIEYVIRNVCM